MHSILKVSEFGDTRRLTVIVAVVLLLVSVAPVLPAQGETLGYLVFRDTVPISSDLGASFHAVVPDGVTVMGADLHLYGTQGVIPVATDSSMAGIHNHTLREDGLHAHGLSLSGDHNHSVPQSGEHAHQVTVYSSHVDTEDEKMSVNLPQHTHSFEGATRIVYSYDFPAITSNGHNHTAPGHSHNTLIGQGGDHSHTSAVGGLHTHDAPDTGDHTHRADAVADHNHSLTPGWTQVEDGGRPGNVTVSVTADSVTTDVPGEFGDHDTDWEETIDMGAYIGTGVSRISFSTSTHGMLEYVLVVEIDQPYGVISGQDVIGPGGELQVPVWVPANTISASAYLFGSDYHMAGTSVDVGGNHTHDALAEGNHVHTVQENLAHSHVVGEGDHEHEGYASNSTPGTTSSTPTWSLPAHRHDLSWVGMTLSNIDFYSYGRQLSNNHNHQVVDHDHVVTINVSGSHPHNMSDDGPHTHVDSSEGEHRHASSQAAEHAHSLAFSPAPVATGGPTGVTAKLDGVAVAGGPWDLGETPAVLDLEPASWANPVALSLESNGLGGVEWVVLVELADPMIMVSAHGITGDMVAHLPVPISVGGARVGVLGSPYKMALNDMTGEGGSHLHRTSNEGTHSHSPSLAGNHTHDLELGGLHVHGMVLNDTVVNVLTANGTVDLNPHTHTAALGSPTTSQNPVTGSTGTHSHSTDPHAHDLNFTTAGTHLHLASVNGNHTHEMADNGSHVHTMFGGDHDHSLTPGVVYDEAFTSPADVDVNLGSHPGVRMDGGDPTWWEDYTVGGGHIQPMSMELLTASSSQVGTLSVVVWFMMDLEPPAPTLEYAPEWVAPGDSFPVIVGVPADIDTGSVVLSIGPVSVDDMQYDGGNGTIEFTCSAPTDAAEGQYDINITAADTVGNVATTTLGSMGIDGTPPDVSMSLGDPNVPDQGFTWVTSGTPVDITMTDATSGPDIIEYAFDGAGPWVEYDPGSNALFEGQPEGATTLHYRGTDKAGNVADVQTAQVTIDDTGPDVQVLVVPSVPGSSAGEVVASPESLVSFIETDGDGVGTETVRYQVEGAELEPIREYDRPFPVSTVDMGLTPTFTVMWFAWDALGNVADGSNELTVRVDPAAPIPSPEGDLSLPNHTTEDQLNVTGQVPGNVARFHYRIDGGSGGVVDIEPDVEFTFTVTLEEGANTLLYSLESPVGVMSEWVVGGVVVKDTEDPSIVSIDPDRGTKDLRTSDLTVSVHFDEAVDITYLMAMVNGKEVAVTWEMHGEGTSATLTFMKDLPGNAVITMEMDFEDPAGNNVSDDWSYKTRTPSVESDLTGMILGLVAGLIIGAMLVFFATFRRNKPTAIVHEGGVTTTTIIPPEEDMSWHEEEDKDSVEEEEPGDEDEEDMEDEEPLEDADEPEVEEEDVPEPVVEVPDDWEEGDIPAEEASDAAEDADDLEDEIDRLLDEATNSPTEDLPDPEEETVDPGSRF